MPSERTLKQLAKGGVKKAVVGGVELHFDDAAPDQEVNPWDVDPWDSEQ